MIGDKLGYYKITGVKLGITRQSELSLSPVARHCNVRNDDYQTTRPCWQKVEMDEQTQESGASVYL